MSRAEYDKMVATGRLQESRNLNGVTNVTYPANRSTYRAGPRDDIYVEFDIPKSAINAHDGSVAKIYGPNSIFGRRLGVKEMPAATNIRIP
jgi:hypothetical protein